MAQCAKCNGEFTENKLSYYNNEITNQWYWVCEECKELLNMEYYIYRHTSYGRDLPDFVIDSIQKQLPRKPLIWKGIQTPESPIPNDDWGYECPMCGNQDIDYPDHHCTCGQRLDWSEF